MRALIQRVDRAAVTVGEDRIAQIGRGLLVFVGVARTDSPAEAEWLARKVANVRLFEDAQGRMTYSALDLAAGVLCVSQFTLYGELKRGHRPDYQKAAPAGEALRLYELFVARLRREGLRVETGRFGAKMAVELVNAGPVTVFLER